MSPNAISLARAPAALPILSRPLSPWFRRLLSSPVLAALATPHSVSSYLQLVNPAWSLDEERAVVVSVHAETADAVTLRLRAAAGAVRFRAGQFVRLTVEVNGVRRTRCYSISCAEKRASGDVEITVRSHAQGTVSQFLNVHAAQGLVLSMSKPEGDFTLPSPRPAQLLFISGGSGITPVMSMLRTLITEGHGQPVTFLHYARSGADLIYAQELEAISTAYPHLNVVTVFTRAPGSTASRGLEGHFDRKHLTQLVPDYANAPTYVCGPSSLIESVQAVFEAEGLAGQLHTEHFEPARPAWQASEVTTGEVRFERSHKTAPNDGRTLLQVAEGAGINPESGCRRGICHTCTRRLHTGQVRDIRTGATCSEPGRDIQLCVHVAVGDVSLDV